MRATDLLGVDSPLCARVAGLSTPFRAEALILDPIASPSDNAGDWVAELIVAAIGGLSRVAAQLTVASPGGTPSADDPALAVLVLRLSGEVVSDRPAACHALAEGLRGAMESVVAEIGECLRVNVIIGAAGADDELLEALAFVASEGGSYVSGALLDIRARS